MMPFSSLMSPRSAAFRFNSGSRNASPTNTSSNSPLKEDLISFSSSNDSLDYVSLECDHRLDECDDARDTSVLTPTLDFLCIVEDFSQLTTTGRRRQEEETTMAESRSSNKEVVSRKMSSSSRQESVTSSSTSSSSMVQQQQQQVSSSSTVQSMKQQQSSTMVSSSTIQLKENKQEVKNQIQSQSSITQKQQIQSQNSVTQSSNNVSSIQQQQQQQQQITQKQVMSVKSQQQQKQIQNQQNLQQLQQQQQQQLEQIENNDEDQNGEEDLKVIGGTHPVVMDLAEENDLYFANMIKKEQILNYENNYSLSDDVVSVVNSSATNSSLIITHPDLISGLTPPPSLVLAQGSESGSQVDIMDDDRDHRSSSRHGDERLSSSRSSNKSYEDSSVGQDQSIGGDLDEEDEDEQLADEEEDFYDEGGSVDIRKKKKKVKKTESFSVIEVFDAKLRDLADKYEVNTKKYDVGPPCELRACEKRVFEKVSVANLRRSFCDLTAQSQSDEEFLYHLVERPKSYTNLDYAIDFQAIKSSFSKFENAAGNNVNSRASPEDEERANRAKNENTKSGTKICKGCDKEVFVMEMIKAEKASWHKNCFRCTECKKSLSMDTYQSNAGLLYCKPHFKELFQPKVVLETAEEKLQKIKKRPEVIIRENQPVELPPDVVRATVQPSTAELEDLSVDVKSKFELFEHYQDSEAAAKERREPVIVKRSTQVLAKLAKYEGSSAMEGQIGVSDADLNGGAPTVVSDDDDEDLSTTKPSHLDEINIKLDDVKSKWESGMNSKKEEIHKHRQEEMAKFRTRLCLGKNSQLKDMYEKAVEASDSEVKRNEELEQLNFKGKRDIKDMFESGIIRPTDEEEEENNERETAIDRDRDVFENGVAKNSRNLFQNLDKQLSSGGQSPQVQSGPGPKKIALRNPRDIIGVNDQSDADIVRSTDIVQDEVRAEDVGNKFRFFESYQQNQESKEKRVFRITPPREGQVKMDSPEREIYRDPNVVRSSDTEQIQIPASRTASKMLSVFKRMEETAAGSDEVDLKSPQRRPLKQFTPPRETRMERKNSSEEEGEQSSEEYESEEEEQYENGGANNVEDQFLKEVGSLARAKSLRAKFEKWEIEENTRNQQQSAARTEYMQMTQEQQQQQTQTTTDDSYGSIESAKALRARFEQPQQFEQNKLPPRREVQVKRFVELQNSNGLNMEECVMCTKRVYAMEKLEVSGKIYHKNCFRCSHCKCLLRMGNYTQNQGILFCTPHFKQLFKIKGNYDEGFGRETGKQLWAKKQLQQKSEGDTKEN